MPAALGGIFCAGVALALIGLIIDRAGYRVIEFLLPPVVTGAIVALIGLNLAPVAKDQFSQQAGIALFTLAAILLATVGLRGLPAKLSVFLGVAAGYVFAAILGKVDWSGVHAADWVGFPDFTTPTFDSHAILLIVPAVVLVLIAENAAHVKAVAAMTERDLDPLIGRSIMADGAATTLAGAFGGVGTTTYAENIGVMGLTRVYSTLAYIIAGLIAIALALLPKFGAVISAIPVGVLGGAVTVLFGLIAVLGARIWIEANVDFRDPVNLTTAAVALIVGAGNFTLHWGDYEFAGIALGTLAAVLVYQILRPLSAETPSPPRDRAPAPANR
jgi:uracil-xanthine permease